MMIMIIVMTDHHKVQILSIEHTTETVKYTNFTNSNSKSINTGYLAWYNVVLTSRVHSSVKYSQPSTVTAADSCDGGISVLNHCLSWSKSLTLTYTTTDNDLTYIYDTLSGFLQLGL